MSSTQEPPSGNSAGDSTADGPWTGETKEKFESKSKSLYLDPCQEAAARSIRCLNRNGGNKEMCGDYFQAYRECRQIWMDKRKEERRKQGFLW